MPTRPLMAISLVFAVAIGGACAVVASRGTVTAVAAATQQDTDRPSYTLDRQLQFPAQYREWVFLTSGLDMTYNAKADASGMSMFGNVFVNPSSYRQFLKSGTWPDGTTFVLENRGAVRGGKKQASINQHGLSQSGELMGHELHVKDASLPGGWGFFAFDDAKTAKMIPRPASCYTCHEQHAAVDTTFVQFYPTILGIAKDKGALSKTYLDEMAAPLK